MLFTVILELITRILQQSAIFRRRRVRINVLLWYFRYKISMFQLEDFFFFKQANKHQLNI